jgi:DNA-binding NarL/FixJ family response regulator
VIEDVEELGTEAQAQLFRQRKAPLKGYIRLRGSESTQDVASEIALGSGRRGDERGLVEDFAPWILRAEQFERRSGNKVWPGIERGSSRPKIECANNVDRRGGARQNQGVHRPSAQSGLRKVVPMRRGKIVGDSSSEGVPDVKIGIALIEIGICARTRRVEVVREGIRGGNVRRMRKGIGTERLQSAASPGREAVEQFRSHRPDITLMDLQMPDMSGIDAIIAIRSEFPDARIIVLTTYAGDDLCRRAMQAGAQAYILKGKVRTDLLDTIRAVRAGKKLIHSEVAAELASHAADDALSAREIEVLSLIAAGNSNKLVADQLAISEDTVKGHVKSILSKLGVNDRTHAVTAALKRGIIEL